MFRLHTSHNVSKTRLETISDSRENENYHELNSPTTRPSSMPTKTVSSASNSALRDRMQVLSAFFVFFNI